MHTAVRDVEETMKWSMPFFDYEGPLANMVLTDALKKNKKAQATFDNFSASHRREYVAWIAEAKTDETRKRRIDQAIEWMSEGKPRNWKYMKTR